MHGFVLDGKSYRQGQDTVQIPIYPAVSGVRALTPLIKLHYRLVLMARATGASLPCGRYLLVP